MEVIQIIAIIFAVFAFTRVILRFKDNNLTPKELLFWSFIWIITIIVAVFPQTISWASEIFGVQRPVDFAIYASIIILFYLVFRIYVKLESIENNITKVVREVAIKKGKKKK